MVDLIVRCGGTEFFLAIRSHYPIDGRLTLPEHLF